MTDINQTAVARVQQLEAQGAGRAAGWDKVSTHTAQTTNGQSPRQTELKQATELLGNTYTDRQGVQHHVDQDGNPINTGKSVKQDDAAQSDIGASTDELSYVRMAAITNPTLQAENAERAYESGNAKDMQYAINDTITSQFAQAMDTHKSSPTEVWKDIQKYAKANRNNSQRLAFNDTLANGTGADRKEAINTLINDFKNHYFK